MLRNLMAGNPLSRIKSINIAYSSDSTDSGRNKGTMTTKAPFAEHRYTNISCSSSQTDSQSIGWWDIHEQIKMAYILRAAFQRYSGELFNKNALEEKKAAT